MNILFKNILKESNYTNFNAGLLSLFKIIAPTSIGIYLNWDGKLLSLMLGAVVTPSIECTIQEHVERI